MSLIMTTIHVSSQNLGKAYFDWIAFLVCVFWLFYCNILLVVQTSINTVSIRFIEVIDEILWCCVSSEDIVVIVYF